MDDDQNMIFLNRAVAREISTFGIDQNGIYDPQIDIWIDREFLGNPGSPENGIFCLFWRSSYRTGHSPIDLG